MATVYIGIGSNLGQRKENCREALRRLAERGITVRRRSSMYETEPSGVIGQPRFINMAVEAVTELAPRELLKAVKAIEREMGRVDAGRWGARVIDLDILLYDEIVMEEAGLVIPHPLMHERDFVLRPLKEIAPDLAHPALKKRIGRIMPKEEH